MATDKEGIPEGWQGLDCGPKSLELFAAAIKSAKTILWNGPAGVFEFPKFANGTNSIIDMVVASAAQGNTVIIGKRLPIRISLLIDKAAVTRLPQSPRPERRTRSRTSPPAAVRRSSCSRARLSPVLLLSATSEPARGFRLVCSLCSPNPFCYPGVGAFSYARMAGLHAQATCHSTAKKRFMFHFCLFQALPIGCYAPSLAPQAFSCRKLPGSPAPPLSRHSFLHSRAPRIGVTAASIIGPRQNAMRGA